MTFTAFILIFISLLLHSLWHFLCKSSGKVSMTFFALFSTALFLTVFSVGVWSGILFKVPWNVLKYAMIGAGCGVFCDLGLMLAYRHSDISLAYPMARALPVFFTMIATMLFRMGKTLSVLAIVGMLIIFVGCICMSFTGGDDKLSLREKFMSMRKGLLGIMIAAVGTTGYTISDSIGIKNIMAFAEGKNTFLVAASYSSCREITATITLWIIVLLCYFRKWEKGNLRNLVKTKHPYMAGFSAALAYLLVLVAMFYVTNVSFVQAFRQLSLPVSAALGFIFLKEKISALRLISLVMIMVGLVICVI